MTWEPLGGAGWNIVTQDLLGGYFALNAANDATTAGNKVALEYTGDTVRIIHNTFTKTYRAVTIENLDVTKWAGGSAGETSEVVAFRQTVTIQALNVRAEWVDGTNFKLTLYTTDIFEADVVTVDTANIAWAADKNIRVISNGSVVTIELDDGAGGWEDAVSISTSFVMDRVTLRTTNYGDAVNTISYGPVGISHYDSASERHDLPTVTFDKPSADGIHHTDYTVTANGADVDEWPSVALDGNLDFVTMAEGETKKQTYGDFDYTVVDDVGVLVVTAQRVNLSDKEATLAALLSDGTNDLEVGEEVAVPSFEPVQGFAAVAPDLGAWTTADFTALEVGVRATNGTDGAQNADVDAVGIEIFDFPADPPPVTGFIPQVVMY